MLGYLDCKRTSTIRAARKTESVVLFANTLPSLVASNFIDALYRAIFYNQLFSAL